MDLCYYHNQRKLTRNREEQSRNARFTLRQARNGVNNEISNSMRNPEAGRKFGCKSFVHGIKTACRIFAVPSELLN